MLWYLKKLMNGFQEECITDEQTKKKLEEKTD